MAMPDDFNPNLPEPPAEGEPEAEDDLDWASLVETYR